MYITKYLCSNKSDCFRRKNNTKKIKQKRKNFAFAVSELVVGFSEQDIVDMNFVKKLLDRTDYNVNSK